MLKNASRLEAVLFLTLTVCIQVHQNWYMFLSCDYKSPGALRGLKFSLWKQNTETTEQKETLDLLFSLFSAAQGGKRFHKKPVASETRDGLCSPAAKRRKALVFFLCIESSIYLCLWITPDISGIWFPSGITDEVNVFRNSCFFLLSHIQADEK